MELVPALIEHTRRIVQTYEEAIKSCLKGAVIPVGVSDDVYRNSTARMGLLSEPGTPLAVLRCCVGC